MIAPPAAGPTDDLARLRLRGRAAVSLTANALLAAAAAWFLMTQLASVLRPLFVAVFLAYVLLPYHRGLGRRVGGTVSIVVLAGAAAGALFLMAAATYTGLAGLNEQMPRLRAKSAELSAVVDAFSRDHLSWALPSAARGQGVDDRLADAAGAVAGRLLNAAADAVVEAGVIGLYLLFLLLEAARVPGRVRRAYPPERADDILHVAGQVNAAVVSYLRAKVKASLVLAAAVGLVLTACDVRFAPLWAVLTFLCNFIPYIGSVVAYSVPAGFAVLQLGVVTESVAAAVLMLVCHVSSAAVVEPMIVGRAVGLSPLVVLTSLAFWGAVWGLPGMFLAVPLTAVAVIVMGHFDSTRPLARLVSGE